MTNLRGALRLAFVSLFAVAGCNSPGSTEASSKRAQALTPGPSFTLQMPPQLTTGGSGLTASTTLTLGDRVLVKQPTGSAFAGIVNLGSGLTKLGKDDKTGDVWSVGSVQLGDRSTVNGFLKTAGTLSPGVNTTITGVLQQGQALPPPTLDTVAVQFQNGASGITVANDATRTLNPGDYAAVSVGARAILALSAGEYRFDSLATQLPSTLRVTTTSGPIRIFVRNTLTWNSTVTTAAGDPAKLLLGYVGSAAITINTPFTGTLLSPNAALTLPTNSSPHNGAFFAKTLTTQPDVVVTTRPFQQPCQGVVIDDGNACTADSCDPSTGVVSHVPATNGTLCSDGNACTTVDSCQAGVCVGSSPVVCTALDQCHSIGVCAPATGQCSNPSKSDGATCSDGSACTQSDTCQAGACVGASPVTCAALDQCHSVGTCNATNGVCSNPTKADGAACADGNACTQSDTCQAGACVGSNPVLCAAFDQCHGVGACNSATGACSNPELPNGAPCSDGNACTQTDSCMAGTCTGTSPVVCAALDQCHLAGSCDSDSGACSNPTKTDGSACTDGNACTQSDTCQLGVCIGSSPVACAALDQCHVAGTCDSASGVCSNPTKSNGSACSDGNSCTQSDACQSGACIGSAPVVCTALDQCHLAGSCDANSGTCSNPTANDGVACNDANSCTTGEACTAGLCKSDSTVATDDGNPCTADACDPVGGVSHDPVSPGTACDDGDLCNGHEACNSIGFCAVGPALIVDDGNPCTADSCDALTGVAHVAVAEGTSCSDANACNGVEVCSSSGQCTAGQAPASDDGNACTEDACDPTLGVTHLPVAAGLSCSDDNACNGEERCDAMGACTAGPAPTVDDHDPCTTDGCAASSGVFHTLIPACAGGTPGAQFESRASIMGRVSHADGSPVTAFIAHIFNDTLDSLVRTDAVTTIESDGSFRIRLTEFPESVAPRTPPQHVLIRLESDDFPSLLRSAFLRPGDVVALGELTVLQRDSKVTVIGPEGGTAEDSQGTLQLQIPPGALSQPTPVQLTPIPTRAQFPAPLPNGTVTMYGMEIEPSGTALASPATLRVKNTLNLPTTMRIPMGTIDARFGDWTHEGMAVWDGSRFTTTISHFSPHDMNAPRLGELVEIVTPGHERNKSPARTCGVGSSANDSTGALEQAFDVPLHAAAGHDYSLSLSYTSELSGSVAVGTGPSGAALPQQALMRSFSPPRIRIACLPAGGGSGGGACGGGSGGGNPPCLLSSGGGVLIPPYTLDQHLKVFNFDVDEGQSQQADSQDFEPAFYVPLPADSAGNPARSGFMPLQMTSKISAQGTGTCVGGGAGFGVNAAFDGGTILRLPIGTGDLLEFPVYQLVVHRRGSPLGSGWAFNEISTLYRTPDGLNADIMHGDGQQETFHPYPVLDSVIQFQNETAENSLAIDAQTGEVFAAQDSSGIRRLDLQSGTYSTAVSGQLFGGRTPVDFKVTYVLGERRFLAATTQGLFEIGADGSSRKLATFISATRAPSVAALGKYAYFAADKKAVGNNSADSTTISRVDLTDPARTLEGFTPVATGDLRLDPHGEVQARDFQFLHPSGLAPAFDGGLYVSDDRRHIVYHLSPDDSGQVGPDSWVTRALGSGSDTMVAGFGSKMAALEAGIRQPGQLALAPDGVLYVKGDATIGGLLAFDPMEQTARWIAFDKTSSTGATDPLRPFTRLSFSTGSLAPLSGTSVLVSAGQSVVRLTTQLSSQYDPTRTLSFDDTGATLLDTSADLVEQYNWRIGQKEAALVTQKRRSGELIRTIAYKDLDRVDYIQDPAGGRVTFDYDGAGHLSTITDPAQRTTHFNIDGSGNLREVIYPSGEARRFEYQDFRMTSATHPNGEASIYTYRADGTLETAKRPGGGITTVMSGYSRGAKYDSTGHVYYESLLTDDRGVQHALSTNVAGVVVADKYTADGQLYDVQNVYAATLGASGPTEGNNRLLRFAYSTVNGLPVTALTTFDPLGRIAKVTQSPISNGANQSMWGFSFDNNRRLSRLAFGSGGTDWAYSYDAAGHLTKAFDVTSGSNPATPTGRSTTYEGFRPQDGQPTTVTSHGIATTLSYDSFGLVSNAVDAVGRSMSATHDAAGNALTVGDGATTLHYGYDPAGRVTSITDAEDHVTTLGYQTAGCSCSNGDRVTSIATPDLAPDQKWAMTYDADGDLQLTTTPLGETETYDHNAQRDLVAIIDRADRPTTFTYDQLGRQASITDPVGRVGTFSYSRPTSASWSGPTLYAQSQTGTPAPVNLTAPLADGQYQVGTNGFRPGNDHSHVALYRDATFQSSQWLAMDSLNRVDTRADRSGLGLPFDSTVPGPINSGVIPFVNESYDTVSPFGLTSVKETNDAYVGNRFWSAHLNRNADFDLTSADGQFLGGISSFPMPPLQIARDTAGRLTGVTFGALASSSIGYQPNGKISSTELATPTWNFKFEGAPCATASDPQCSATKQCGAPQGSTQKRCGLYTNDSMRTGETFQYDARGLVSTRSLPLVTGTAQYSYDAVGRNVLLVFPDGHQRVQLFDALGRLTSRCYQYTDGTPDHCYTAQYDSVGNPKVLTDPDMRREISYDTLDRVTEVRRYVPPTATTPAHTETYAYNALGAFSVYDGVIVDDQRPRLSGGGKASAGIPASYAGQPIDLDGGGRVTAFNGQIFQYFKFEHTLQTLTNTSTNTRQTFIYDALQRLTDIHSGPPNDARPTKDETLVYRDLSSSIAGVVTTPHTNNAPPDDPDLANTAFHVGYDGVDQPLWIAQQGALLYYEVDAVGNVRRLHGDASPSTWSGEQGGYSYTAFGKTIAASEPGGVAPPSSELTQPFQWQGKRLMAPGLYDSRARVWSAELGAFLQPDEYVFLTRSGTLWSWPGQNPFKWRDPSGRAMKLPNGSLPTDGYFGIGGAVTGAELARELMALAADDLAHCRYAAAYEKLALANIAAQAGVASAVSGVLAEILLGAVGAKGGGEISAATPIGAKGRLLTVPDGTNAPATIGGREFSGHALDRMQSQGMMPSAVENTIQGNSGAGKEAGTTAHYDPVNNITVITNSESGRVVTSDYGYINQSKR